MKKFLLVSLLCLGFSLSAFAQFDTTIPYEMIGGKMRIKLSVNNTPQYFIFDTGGKTTITKEVQEQLDLPFLDSVAIIDVTSHQRSFPVHKIDLLKFGEKGVGITGVPCMVLDKGSKVFSYFDAIGIIGNDVISNFIVEIDAREKTIRFLPQAHQTTGSLRNVIKFDSEDNPRHMPIFNIGLDLGQTIRVLFDTGLAGLLSVHPSEYERLKDTGAISDMKEGISRSVMGVAGEMKATKDIRVKFSRMNVAVKKFQNISASVSNVPISLLGTNVLNYGKVILDFPRSRFFFEPFDKEVVTMKSTAWNIGLTVNNGGLYVSSLWGDKMEQANIGDQVLKIDGEDVPELDFTKTLINGLELLRGKKVAELTIKSGDDVKVVTMEQE